MNDKALIELRNAKVSEMRNVVSGAKAAGRALTDEEKTKFADLEKEVKDIDDTIEINNRVAENYLQKAPEVGAPAKEDDVMDEAAKKKLYAKERKEFANSLRNILKNTADSPTTKSDMSVMIPTTVWDHIIEKVLEICPIYDWADKFDIEGNFIIPVDNDEGDLEVAWTEEFDELVSGNVRVGSIELKGYLAGILAKISRSLINNTKFDIVGFVEAKIARKIAKFVEKQFLFGTSQKAEGLSTIDENQTHTTEYSNTFTPDDLIDTQDLIPDDYQANCRWIMHRNTRNVIRKFKDKMGDYMLNRDLTAKWGYTLLGKDVYTSKQMNQIAADTVVVFYGDFSGLAAKIVEHGEIEVLREKYATQHALGLCAWMEFDCKIADREKIAQMKMGHNAAPASETYTVTYDVNGGTGTIAAVTVNAGESVTLNDGTGITAPENKEFLGWAKTSSAQSATVTSPFTPTGDVTLYAVYGDEQ